MGEYRNYQELAISSHLGFRQPPEAEVVWQPLEDSPFVSEFVYELLRYDPDGDEYSPAGRVDGLRVRHNWDAGSDHEIWDQADSISADAAAYVDALIREHRALGILDDLGLPFSCAKHTTIIRHVEGVEHSQGTAELWTDVAACLLLQDVPTYMLIDPGVMSGEASPQEALDARVRAGALVKALGFTRMVGANYVWGWDRESGEGALARYDHGSLIEAARRGDLNEAIDASLFSEIYGRFEGDE